MRHPIYQISKAYESFLQIDFVFYEIYLKKMISWLYELAFIELQKKTGTELKSILRGIFLMI